MSVQNLPLRQHCIVCHRIPVTLCDGCGAYLCEQHVKVVPSPYDGGIDEEFCSQCYRRFAE